MEMVGGKGLGAPLEPLLFPNSAFDVTSMHLAKGLGRGAMVSEQLQFRGMRMVMHHLQSKSARKFSSWELEEVMEPW